MQRLGISSEQIFKRGESGNRRTVNSFDSQDKVNTFERPLVDNGVVEVSNIMVNNSNYSYITSEDDGKKGIVVDNWGPSVKYSFCLQISNISQNLINTNIREYVEVGDITLRNIFDSIKGIDMSDGIVLAVAILACLPMIIDIFKSDNK